MAFVPGLTVLLTESRLRSLEDQISELRGAVQTMKRAATQPISANETTVIESSDGRRVRRRTNATDMNRESDASGLFQTNMSPRDGIRQANLPSLQDNDDTMNGARPSSQPPSGTPKLSASSLPARYTLFSEDATAIPSENGGKSVDLISRGLISISVARELFEQFVHQCGALTWVLTKF